MAPGHLGQQGQRSLGGVGQQHLGHQPASTWIHRPPEPLEGRLPAGPHRLTNLRPGQTGLPGAVDGGSQCQLGGARHLPGRGHPLHRRSSAVTGQHLGPVGGSPAKATPTPPTFPSPGGRVKTCFTRSARPSCPVRRLRAALRQVASQYQRRRPLSLRAGSGRPQYTHARFAESAAIEATSDSVPRSARNIARPRHESPAPIASLPGPVRACRLAGLRGSRCRRVLSRCPRAVSRRPVAWSPRRLRRWVRSTPVRRRRCAVPWPGAPAPARSPLR